MNPFESMQDISLRNRDRIAKTCAPIAEHFGISHFSYTKITNTGYLHSLSSRPDWLEYYFCENLYIDQPHFRHPKNFTNGIAIADQIEDDSYTNLSQKANQKFNIYFGFVFMNKILDGLELIGFDLNSKNKLHQTLMLNEFPLLRKFISYFLSENRPLLDLMEEKKVNIGDLLGVKFDTADVKVMDNLPDRHRFLTKIGVDIAMDLTVREKEILKGLIEGYSASGIANKIHLSPRTVESYIVNIKISLIAILNAKSFKKHESSNSWGSCYKFNKSLISCLTSISSESS